MLKFIHIKSLRQNHLSLFLSMKTYVKAIRISPNSRFFHIFQLLDSARCLSRIDLKSPLEKIPLLPIKSDFNYVTIRDGL